MNKLYAGTTDPMDLRGFGLIEVIGSNYGSFRCAVNCYGVPMRTEWYNLYEEHVVLRELKVKLIDKETGAETGETAILKPGQLVIFFRSDGLTIMDILLPDLSAARIETDGRGTWTIGGEGASTYFEDIVVVD